MLNFKNLVLTFVFMAGSLFADDHGAMKAKKMVTLSNGK